MADQAKTFMVEDARLIFRNFSGREGPYNRPGDASFCVILDPDTAMKMLEDGWNVKYLKPQEEGEEGAPYINVAVKFDKYPPKVFMITDTARTRLDVDSVIVLDWADIRAADLIARGSDWATGDKSGTKAYLQSLFVTIEEDALEKKYAINDNVSHNE